jgi:tryptophan-rich sensory protein
MKLKELLILVVGTLIIGGLGAFLGDFNMYNSLIKPSFSPPSYVFPIAWTILYILMGISLYLIYISKSEYKKEAIVLYAVQLFVNVTWTLIFFGLKLTLPALIWLMLLFALVFVMTIEFYKINKVAGLLQIPYLLWLVFAGMLNYSIYILNT